MPVCDRAITAGTRPYAEGKKLPPAEFRGQACPFTPLRVLPLISEEPALKAVDPADAQVLTITQCKMARSAMDWSVNKLSKKSGVSARTIARFESGTHSPGKIYLRLLRQTFEVNGVVFNEDGSVRPPPGSM